MVRKRVLQQLLVATSLLVLVGFVCFVVKPAFVVPCPDLEEQGGLGSWPAPAPSPGSGGCKDPADCICLRVPYAVPLAFCAVVGFITGSACRHCYDWLVDGEEEEEADEAAKKAGYIAIAGGDLEVAAGTGAGASKN